MPDSDPAIRLSIEHSIKVLSRWTIALYLAVAVFLGGGILANRQLAAESRRAADRTNTALCAFTADLQRRVDATREYLQKHPEREPIPGISRVDLRRSLQNQRRTLDSLGGLDCS